MSSPRRGSLRIGGGGALVHKPHWASRCTGSFEPKDVPFERSIVPVDALEDIKLPLLPYTSINPIPKVDPERLQSVFAFAVSAFSEATNRNRDAEEIDPEKRALNLASKFGKRWSLRAAARSSADTDAVFEEEVQKPHIAEVPTLPIASKVRTFTFSDTDEVWKSASEGHASPGRSYASEPGRGCTPVTSKYASEPGRGCTPVTSKYASEPGRAYGSEASSRGFTYASTWKAFGISSVGGEDDTDETGASSSCASPTSPRSVRSSQGDRSQRHRRLTRPVNADEFAMAKPPVPLKISDFPPISHRKKTELRSQGINSHYDYFDKRCTKFPDGLMNPQHRRKSRQRVMNLAITVASPSRQDTQCNASQDGQDMRVDSVSPPQSPKSRRSDGSFLPHLAAMKRQEIPP